MNKDHSGSQAFNQKNTEIYKSDVDVVEQIKRENKALREALDFYADRQNYNSETGSLSDMRPHGMRGELFRALEFGERARRALGKL